MRNILLIGAGKSASVLVDYLLEHAAKQDWNITIGDLNVNQATSKIHGHERAAAVLFDIQDEKIRSEQIKNADLVISMLPARFHYIAAMECLKFRKHLITPSYISEEMKKMHQEVKSNDLLFLNEMGLDPGIDHMSAKQMIDKLQEEKVEIVAFESFTGGLVAPESDDNPWHYKLTWNPRNVIMAGQGPGGIKFLHNGKYKYIPYHKLFARNEIINIEGFGEFEGYANRNSLKYQHIYGLEKVQTMYRGTLRRPYFCKAWDILVQLGATDDSYEWEHAEDLSYRDFINSFLKYRSQDTVELKLAYYCDVDVDAPEMDLLRWAGFFSNEKIGLKKATPAQIVQKLLEEKWAMKPNDKDMIVMWHKFNFIGDKGFEREINASLVVTGDDQEKTAMAKTVGLPIGIASKLLLNGKINSRGVVLPIYKEIYNPVLEELKSYGIRFSEKEIHLHSVK